MTDSAKKKDQDAAHEGQEQASSANPSHPDQARRPKPEVGGLDLSIEEVEERISPSETNVFDK